MGASVEEKSHERVIQYTSTRKLRLELCDSHLGSRREKSENLTMVHSSRKQHSLEKLETYK